MPELVGPIDCVFHSSVAWDDERRTRMRMSHTAERAMQTLVAFGMSYVCSLVAVENLSKRNTQRLSIPQFGAYLTVAGVH